MADSGSIIMLDDTIKPLEKIRIVLRSRRRPGYFRYGGYAGEGMVLDLLEVLEILGPQLSLDPEDVFRLVRSEN